MGGDCAKCGARRIDNQIGLERTPELYVARMVEVFREVRRILRPDGCVFLNLGDSYASGKGTCYNPGENTSSFNVHLKAANVHPLDRGNKSTLAAIGLKPKDLIGIPWRVAFALQADGWWLRSDIIWCLSGGTWLYARTQKGDMPIMVRDLARLQPETVKLWNGEKWTQLLGINRNHRGGDEIEFVLRSGERISCTPTHRFPTQRGILVAGEIKVGDKLQACRLPQPENPRDCALDEDAAWFAGLYLAEGSRSGDKIQIAGHVKETERWERCDRIARKYGGSAHRDIDGNCQNIRMYGKVLNAIIDEFVGGKTATDKGFATVVWRYSDAFIAAMLDGYLSGDAHRDAKNDRWRLGFTRNYNLERDLRTACARLGYKLKLTFNTVEYDGKQVPTFRGEIRKVRSGHHNEKCMTEVVEIRKARCREVYDLGVADEPHLFALASGVLTHNSKPNPMPESVTDRPTKSHEYIFLLTKSARYFYDAEAIREPHQDKNVINGTYKGAGGVNRDGYEPHTQGFNGSGVVMKNQDYNPNGRNARTVWTIATQPFSGAKLLADYVGPDGKPYTASPDCPLHGHLARSRKSYTAGCDVPQAQIQPRNSGNGNGHVPARAPLLDAMTFHSSPDADGDSVQPQMPESTPDCRSAADRRESTSDARTADRTSRMSESHGVPDCKTDSLAPSCSVPANGHNTQTSRTDHARPTSQHDTACARTADRTPSTSQSDAPFDSVDRTPASSSGEYGCSDTQGLETSSRTVDTETLLGSSVASFTSTDDYTCTCEIVQVDHFATFPPKLVEPCIMAGTSAHGCCPECGAPWVRVVEKPDMSERPTRANGAKMDTDAVHISNNWQGVPKSAGQAYQEWRNANPDVTTGWRPTCDHDAAPIPCTVLDPFAGSGTTLAVALALGRNAIGIELNPEYVQLAERRLAGITPALFGV